LLILLYPVGAHRSISVRIHEGIECFGPYTDDMIPYVATFDWVRIYRQVKSVLKVKDIKMKG
jgi:hypothetical protein